MKRATIALCLLTTVSYAAAEHRVIEVAGTRPSVGPGSDGSLLQSEWADIEVEDAGALMPAPRASLSAEEPSPLTPGTVLAFDGVNGTAKGSPDCCIYKPPDTHLAVGTGAGAAGRVVMVTNSGVQIWDKNGTSLAGPTPLVAFLPAVPNTCSSSVCPGAFDPKVLFDQHSGRFFIVVLEGMTPNPGGTSNIRIAVSTSATPSNTTFHWTKLAGSALTTVGGFNTWFDYPSIAADTSSLVVTGNLFDGGGLFRGVKLRFFNKASLLAGFYTFNDIDVDNAVTPGIGTPQPAHAYGATDSGDFYLINTFGPTNYRLWEISGAPAAPVIVGNAVRTWAAGPQAFNAPQSGTAVALDTLSSRTMNAIYRGGHVWTVLSADTDGDSKTEVFWVKVATNGGLPTAPTIADTGFIDGSDGDEWTFLPSVNVNASGDATIVYTQSFTDQFPEIRYASRASGGPAGTFQTSLVPTGGTSPGFYDSFGTPGLNGDRWGDFAATVVDPDDDTTFWIAQEVVMTSAVNSSIWKTRIYKLGVVSGTTTTAPTTTSTTSTTLIAPIGHLKCYRTRDARAKAAYMVDLMAGVGAFPNELGCTLKLGSKRICVEVDKQNVAPPPPGGGPTPAPNAGSVFLSYKLKCPAQTVAPTVFADQFGPGLFPVGKASELLVPALPGPPNDHLECYKTKDPRPRATYTVDLMAGVAGFTNELGCTVKLGAKEVCVQVTKQNVTPLPPGGGPAPGPGSGAMLVSYKLKCPTQSLPPIGAVDQFGAGTFTPGKAAALLVPAGP